MLKAKTLIQPLAKIWESPILEDVHSVVLFCRKKRTDHRHATNMEYGITKTNKKYYSPPTVLFCTTSGFYNSLQSLRHGFNKWQTVLLISLAPTFSYCCCQIFFAGWSLVMDRCLQFLRQIFNWIEIRTIWWPWHWPHVSFIKEIFYSFLSMTRCIIILQNDVIIPKHPFNWWGNKSVQNFNANLLIY